MKIIPTEHLVVSVLFNFLVTDRAFDGRVKTVKRDDIYHEIRPNIPVTVLKYAWILHNGVTVSTLGNVVTTRQVVWCVR